MSHGEAAESIRTILDAYRAMGMGARIDRGQIFIQRPGGWEGPLDPAELRETYRDELIRVEWLVRRAVADLLDRLDEQNRKFLPREILLEWYLKPDDFAKLGFSASEAILFSNVAQHLLHDPHARPL